MALSETVVDEAFIELMNEYRKKPEGKGLIEACSESVVLFSEYMLGFRLYSWQVRWLVDIQQAIEDRRLKVKSNREFLALTSRQIGKSTALAILYVWACTFNKLPGTLHNNTQACIVSATDQQSKKLLHEIEKMLKHGDRFMAATYLDENQQPRFGKKFFTALLDAREANNTTTITFKAYDHEKHGEYLLKGSTAGSVIKSFPPTAVVLGETFSLLAEDEAGLTERITDQFHEEYAYPTGNSTDAVRLYTSTPWVPSGFFYRLADPNEEYTSHPAERVLFSIDAIRIENPKYREDVQKTIDQKNKDGHTDEVQRAYYCRFVKGEASYFNPERIKELFTNEYQALEVYSGECDCGIDYGGQVTSKTSVTISCLKDGKIRRLYHRKYEVGKDLSLLDDIANLKTRFNIQRIIPDDCPAGDFLNRIMIEQKAWNVTPMNFRAEKVKKYGAFRAALNRGEIESFVDDDLKTEMLAMEFNQGKVQSIIMHAPGYTDDMIDSFVMSTYYYVEEDSGFKYYNMDDYNDDDYNDSQAPKENPL